MKFNTNIKLCNNNRMNILFKVIIIIVCIAIFFMLFVINRLSDKFRNYTYETFEDKPANTEETEESIANSTKCPDTKNIVDICINLEGCCSNSGDTGCRCSHPLIKSCAEELKKCNESVGYYDKYPELKKQKCRDQLKNCCLPYENIKIDTAKYEIQSAEMVQPFDTKICVDMNTNFDNCSKLCLTNENCKSFRLDNIGNCTLYNSFNPKSPAFGGKSISPNQAGVSAFNKASVDSKSGFYKII